jgi:hypothetical protein
MEYIKRDTPVQAVQFNSVTDIEKVWNDCRFIASAQIRLSDTQGVYALLIYDDGKAVYPITVDQKDWVVWNDRTVKVMSDERFHKKYVARNSIAVRWSTTNTANSIALGNS